MTTGGPEQLVGGPRAPRGRTWLAVGAAVLVVAGLGAVRLVAPEPGPAPAPTTSTVQSSTAWPTGLGAGTLYVLDRRGVATIDVGSGLVQRSTLDVDPSAVTLTPGRYGVLVWPEDGAGTAHEVAPGVPPPGTVTGVLATSRRFLPATGLDVWASKDEEAGEEDASTWRLVDEGGATRQVRRLDGTVVADGSGGLFAQQLGVVRHVEPGQPDTTWAGALTATGPDGWEARECTRARCTEVLHDRVTGAESVLPSSSPSDVAVGALAPGNRFVAALVQPSRADASPLVIQVSPPAAPRQLRFLETPDDGRSSAWLSDHWLAGTGRQGLVLYDAAADRLVTPDVDVTGPRVLVFRPA